MTGLCLLEPILFNNKCKVFDIKYDPQQPNNLALVDFKGRLRILNTEKENPKVLYNYKISSDSLHSLNYSDNGDSKI
jgi:hypothetical protein